MRVGLANTGNSCFVNSAVQIVFHSPDLFHLFQQTWDPTFDINKSYTISPLLRTIRQKYASEMGMGVFEQCDAGMFFCWMLDKIKDNTSIDADWFTHLVIQVGRLSYVCVECGTREVVIDRQFCQSVYVLPDIDKSVPISFYEVMERQIHKIQVTHKCTKCGDTKSILRRKTLSDPKHLFFLVHEQHYRILLNEAVGTTLSHYELKGFIVHLGRTVHSGHYVVYIREEDDWWLFNDSQITPTSVESFLDGTYPQNHSIKLIWFEQSSDNSSDSE